ncbi:tripartite tricarboxylate transporter permease [Microbacterium sp. NPDC078428]|uniref:tripartite tricarboxylate transporter permease n=1 Tax=Microbacterium sp. NPDC078428 TaxID=3364190 RepID=UPI0037CBBD56
MDPIDGFLSGLALALSPELLMAALIAAFIGTLIGVLPGLGPVAGAAIVLPLTFAFEPAVGLILIAGIYLGAQYGGSTSSILLNIPGDASAVVATFDGHPMAKKGRAGAALALVAIGSFISGTIGLTIVVLSATTVSQFALEFGSAEFFALTAGGLLALARISGGSIGGGLLPMILGIAVATVGMEMATSYQRFTFGNLDLSLGLSIAVVAVGLYGISEMMYLLEERDPEKRLQRIRMRELVPTRTEFRRALAPWGRGSFLGFFFGLLPVPSATLSTFTSYRLEKSISRRKDEFGKGAVEGLTGPEAANNSAAIGSIVPVLLLGLPFSATLALMISAMVVQGIQPGPLILEQRPELFWSVLAALGIANLMLLVLNLPMIGVWVRVLQIRRHYLVPVIVVVAAIGAFSVSNNMINIYLMVAIGIVGYVLRKFNFSLASMLIGVVLGPLIEKYYMQVMFISRGDPIAFVASPIAAAIWTVVGVVIIGGFFWPLIRRARAMRRGEKVSAIAAEDND